MKGALDIQTLFSTTLRSGLALRLLALLLSFFLIALVVLFTGHSVRDAFSALWSGSTGLQYGPPLSFDKFTVARILAETTPLLLCGLAVAACLRAGLFNIGAAGQMTFGAFATAWVGLGIEKLHLGPFLLTSIALGSGCIAGALCGAVVGWLKAYRNVHEVISTIMLNYVLADLTQYLITNHLRDPASMDVQTRKLSDSLWLGQLVMATNLTSGIFIALLALVAYILIIEYTAFGFRIRALGAGPAAARATGIPIARTTIQVMGLGGLLAGAAGAIQVLGIYHRDLADIAGGYGFQGIAVALLAGSEGPGMLLSSLFFGGLNNGATIMQLEAGVPSSLISIVQAVIIVASAVKIVRATGVLSRRRAENEAAG